MNSLEQAVSSALPRAQKIYTNMTGWWLHHGPESYLQHAVAFSIFRNHGGAVFTEVSPKKIAAEFSSRGRGKRYEARKRFDVIVWQKSSDKVGAVIEIKRSWRFDPVRADAKKIESYLKHKRAPKSGYLLVYSDAGSAKRRSTARTRRQSLSDRFGKWRGKLEGRKWVCVTEKFFSQRARKKGEPAYSWAFMLLKLQRSAIV